MATLGFVSYENRPYSTGYMGNRILYVEFYQKTAVKLKLIPVFRAAHSREEEVFLGLFIQLRDAAFSWIGTPAVSTLQCVIAFKVMRIIFSLSPVDLERLISIAPAFPDRSIPKPPVSGRLLSHSQGLSIEGSASDRPTT
ncbi:hypothetical protein RRG08_044026 [Elysia crispata]|uniref:Uncharacterized protein n=1 Tax=Elysia crispata TaxID=231223 RepID=A0AAE0Y1F1_9GAST|nr:hypothetical protein RRG08_044026 [Elysia crispata]